MFYLLKKSNTGGPFIVFNRYHKKDVTKITRERRKRDKYILDKEGKLIQKIVWFDANALNNTLGFDEVDIEVPKNNDMYIIF